ncbi:MAG TPA: tetratricopeptide repeat protein [Bryobacteraceae bacterium]|nr:tetratricopeptide repeat protein [Bryobacteraceae bacterium]
MLLLLVLLAAQSPNANSSQAREHLASGNQLLQAEGFADAAEEFRQALEGDATLTEARDRLAICYFELRDYDRARPLFDQLSSNRGAAGIAAYYLGRMDLAEGNLQSAIRRLRSIPHDHPVHDEWYYLASAYYKEARYQECVQILRQAMPQNSRDARIHQLLARAFLKTGRNGEAEREFAETRRLHDYYQDVSTAIGRCRAQLVLQNVAEGWKLCRPLLDTDDVDKVVAIGMLFGKFEDYAHAREAWEKAVALDADSSEVQYNLGLTCFHLKDLRHARDYAAAAVKLRPDFAEANVLYGTILYMGGEDNLALSVLAHAHELKPADKNVDRLLAEELTIAATRENCTQALDALQKAKTLEPDLKSIGERLVEIRARCPAR